MERSLTKSSSLEVPRGPSLPSRRSPMSPIRRATAWCLLPLALGAYLLTHLATPHPFPSPLDSLWPGHALSEEHFRSACAQPGALLPKADAALDRAYESLSSASFRNASVARLSGAVQVRTESFDDLGPIGEDARWDVMYDFAAYLRKTFPLLHARLALEVVNTHGLLYTWAGSDSALKPTLLMAHQDTVPVARETVDAWTHPPWSGAFDGTYVWGRGASDCKNQLIAVMEALETLLAAGFAPRRTLLVALGFDEECSGRQGAGHLAERLHERYGDDGLAVIVDEGGGFEKAWGAVFAKPGTGEKGYTDVVVTVNMPGGHSSVPADHTSIGVLAELLTLVESEQYATRLVDENPYYAQLQCGAAYAPDFPPRLKKLLARREAETARGHPRRGRSGCHHAADAPDYLALEAAKQGPATKYLMQTSQAVDVISGGAKVNALPEVARAVVNHRINVGETPRVAWDRLTVLARRVAARHNLTVHAFGAENEACATAARSGSTISLAASEDTLEVAPVTPADGAPFAVLAGTVRALYGEEVVVAPGIMTGNTDTRYMWRLTRHIFRFGPGFDPQGDPEGLGGIHTVDEHVSVENHVNVVKWFVLFVRNMDEADV